MNSATQLSYILPTAPKSLCGCAKFIFQLNSVSCLKTISATATAMANYPVTEFQGLTSTSIPLSWLYQLLLPCKRRKMCSHECISAVFVTGRGHSHHCRATALLAWLGSSISAIQKPERGKILASEHRKVVTGAWRQALQKAERWVMLSPSGSSSQHVQPAGGRRSWYHTLNNPKQPRNNGLKITE